MARQSGMVRVAMGGLSQHQEENRRALDDRPEALRRFLALAVFALDATACVLRLNRVPGGDGPDLILAGIDDEVARTRLSSLPAKEGPGGSTLRVKLENHAHPMGELFFFRDHGRFDARAATFAEAVGAHTSYVLSLDEALHSAHDGYEAMRQRCAMVAHNLRSPLQSVAMFLDALALDPVEGARLSADDRFSRIRRNVASLAHMVSDLHEVVRFEAGCIPLECRPTSLPETTLALVGALEPMLGKHTVSVDVVDTPPAAFVDPVRYEQILINLLDNAAKYSPDGEPISIRIALHGEGVAVSIADRGVGIPADQLARLFDPACALSVPKSRGGLGLGLHIAHELVKAQNGKIDAESTPGHGSRFTVWFPRA